MAADSREADAHRDDPRDIPPVAFAMELMGTVLERAGRHGVQNSWLQAFVAEDLPADKEPELADVELDREQSRTLVASRIADGFRGLAAFACLERVDGKPYLRAEAYNTYTGQSVSGTIQVRATLTGKLRPVGEALNIDGFPTLAGAFPLDGDPASTD